MYSSFLILPIVPVLTKPVHANFTDQTGRGNLMYVRMFISICLDVLQVPSVLGNSVYYDLTVGFARNQKDSKAIKHRAGKVMIQITFTRNLLSNQNQKYISFL